MNYPDIEQATEIAKLAQALVALGATVASAAAGAVRAYRARRRVAARTTGHGRTAGCTIRRPQPRIPRRRRQH